MADTLAATLRGTAETPSGFSRVYTELAQDVFVFFVRRTFDVEVARDLTAETFAQAFEHRRRFRGQSDAEVKGWLYGIARHQLSRYARRGVVRNKAVERLGVLLPTVAEDDYLRVVELAGLSDLRTSVAAAFSNLPLDQRNVLQLRVIEEREYGDVAATLGVSEQTARARVSRALRRLADATDITRPRGVIQ